MPRCRQADCYGLSAEQRRTEQRNGRAHSLKPRLTSLCVGSNRAAASMLARELSHKQKNAQAATDQTDDPPQQQRRNAPGRGHAPPETEEHNQRQAGQKVIIQISARDIGQRAGKGGKDLKGHGQATP